MAHPNMGWLTQIARGMAYLRQPAQPFADRVPSPAHLLEEGAAAAELLDEHEVALARVGRHHVPVAADHVRVPQQLEQRRLRWVGSTVARGGRAREGLSAEEGKPRGHDGGWNRSAPRAPPPGSAAATTRALTRASVRRSCGQSAPALAASSA
eukprot:3871982-Prymnesium_polylepis.1